MSEDIQTNGNRRTVELEVTGEDLSAVLRIKANQVSQLELQIMALTRMLADRDQKISLLEADKKSVSMEEVVTEV
jgi:phage shock protein A